jgi:hypothetical protein
LTIVTQVGGLIYLISILFIRNRKKQGLKRLGLFIALYAISVFIVIPNFAKLFGRQQIEDNANLESHSFFYNITNRTYVKPELNDVLVNLSKKIKVLDKNLKIIYLDANFPFFDGFRNFKVLHDLPDVVYFLACFCWMFSDFWQCLAISMFFVFSVFAYIFGSCIVCFDFLFFLRFFRMFGDFPELSDLFSLCFRFEEFFRCFSCVAMFGDFPDFSDVSNYA